MKYKILFKHFTIRTTPIYSNYRPDWCSNSKPEYNCARLLFKEKGSILPGEECECEMEPFVPSMWKQVQVNDIMKCFEGQKQVGEALILEILS